MSPKFKQPRPQKARLFTNLPIDVYEALDEATRQNHCTKATYVIRALIMRFRQDGIKYFDRDPNITE